MARSLQSVVLEGLDPNIDFLGLLPVIEDIANGTLQDEELSQLGITTIAVAALAAVERFAKDKKLRKGTKEPLLIKAHSAFMAAMAASARWSGESDVMNLIAQENPASVPLLNQIHIERLARSLSEKQRIAKEVASILAEIQRQQIPQGKRGKKANAAIFNPESATAMRDYQDSEIIKTIKANLPLSDKDNPEKIRTIVRSTVKDYIALGVITMSLGNTAKENIDSHCKRILQKYES